MLRYIELKSGHHDNGPAWIGYVKFSRTRRTLYFNGKAFHRASGGYGASSNYLDIETREAYWISGVKKRGSNRHTAGSGEITIERGAIAEYLRVTGAAELDRSRFIIADSILPADPSRFVEMENEPL